MRKFYNTPCMHACTYTHMYLPYTLYTTRVNVPYTLYGCTLYPIPYTVYTTRVILYGCTLARVYEGGMKLHNVNEAEECCTEEF